MRRGEVFACPQPRGLLSRAFQLARCVKCACVMSIVCGTDFSEGAERALLAAALLAARSQTKLHLMHCVQFSSEVIGADLKEVHIEWMNDLLRRQADTARACGAE